MKTPERPDNENERLSRLRQLEVLDTPIEERFERITRIVCRTLNVSISAVSLIDDQRQWFKSAQGLTVSETPRDVSFCGHAILQDGPFIVSDASADPRFADNPLVTGGPGIRFYAGCPITLGDGLRIGTLCAIDDKPRTITQEDLAILRDLTEMVRSELESVSLSEAHQMLIAELAVAERAALIDPLTRLWNRAGSEKLLAREWDSHQRRGVPLSILMVDIDHFKEVNDELGHAGGDTVLRIFSGVLLSGLRPYDTVCRWGGDEFLVLLPECSSMHLKDTLERLMDQILATTFEVIGKNQKVTASIGAFCINMPTKQSISESLQIADKNLYDAKGAGRNQFRITTCPAMG